MGGYKTWKEAKPRERKYWILTATFISVVTLFLFLIFVGQIGWNDATKVLGVGAIVWGVVGILSGIVVVPRLLFYGLANIYLGGWARLLAFVVLILGVIAIR